MKITEDTIYETVTSFACDRFSHYGRFFRMLVLWKTYCA